MRNCGFDIWNGTVEYSHAALEAVRAQAVAGLTALSHGGLEVGGVLYGERRGGVTRVISTSPLECEHASGPGFVLSDRDAARFRELLKPREGLRAVGWYCSHTRSGLALSPNDCAILERFFPDGGSVALLVKPMRSGPAEATFYLQGNAEPGPHFSILPAPAQPRVEAPTPAPAPLPVEAAPVAAPAPAAAAAWWNSLPPLDALTRLDLPRLRSAGVGVGVAALAILSLALLTGNKVESAGTKLGLQVYPLLGRQMRIEWDRQSPAVRAGKSGTVVIADGGSRRVVSLNAEQLHTNSLTYESRTGAVEVRMKVANGPEESVKVAAPAPPEPRPTQDPVYARVEPPTTTTARPPQPVATQPAAPPPAAPLPAAQQPETQPIAEQPRMDASREASSRQQPSPLKRFELDEPSRSSPPLLANVTLPEPPPAAVGSLAGGVPKLAIPATAPPVVKPRAGVRSGRLIWTGELKRRGVVEIEGSTATVGSVSGSLPGVPVTLRVSPAKFDREVLVVYSNEATLHNKIEAPGPLTGWNRLRFVWDPQELSRISILEAPRADNQFGRLALRNEGKPCEVIVVEWHVN